MLAPMHFNWQRVRPWSNIASSTWSGPQRVFGCASCDEVYECCSAHGPRTPPNHPRERPCWQLAHPPAVLQLAWLSGPGMAAGAASIIGTGRPVLAGQVPRAHIYGGEIGLIALQRHIYRACSRRHHGLVSLLFWGRPSVVRQSDSACKKQAHTANAAPWDVAGACSDTPKIC